MNLKHMFVAQACAAVLIGGVLAQEPQEPQTAAKPQDSPYLGASGCKECHQPYFEAWADTKHARAFNRLGERDRANGQCIRCHATGTPEQIQREGATPSLPGVQCESCHGAGRTHAAAAAAGPPPEGSLVAQPGEQVCSTCHNDTSPHYKPFYFRAMVALVHRVR